MLLPQNDDKSFKRKRTFVAYMKHKVLYHWSLCACIVIGCVIRVYIGSCVATSES